MNVICLEEDAFFELVNQTVSRLTEKQQYKKEWVNADEAMKTLGISSTTTLQKLRDKDEIRYSQHMPKLIMYDANSLEDYLNRNANVPKKTIPWIKQRNKRN